MNMEPLIPHVLLEDEDYKVFLELISIVHDDVKEMISKFPELVDIDNAPEIFLPKLSALIRYKYRHDIDEDIQREIIKRIISIYRDRGTDDAIIMAATYGNDPLWIGSHVFLPGADTNKPRATITHPIDYVFRHDISKHSGLHRFADATRWTAGTLIINVTYLDDEIRNAIKKVIPAGLRIYFDIISTPGGDGEFGEVIFGEWTLWEFYELDYSVNIKDRLEVAIFDVKGSGRRLRSGRQLLFDSMDLEIYKGWSMLPIEDKLLYRNNIKVQDLKMTDIVKCIDTLDNTVYKQVGNLVKTFGFNTTKTEEDIAYVFKKLFNLELDDMVFYDNSKTDGEIESDFLSDIMHDIDYEIGGIYVKKKHRGPAIRSETSSIRSGKYAMDGTYTGEISYICPIEDVIPTDRWYPMAAIEDIKPGEYLKDYCTPTDLSNWSQATLQEIGDLKLSDLVNTGYEYRKLSSLKLVDNTTSGTVGDNTLSTEVDTSVQIINEDEGGSG